MPNFIDEFMKSYGPEVTSQLSSNLNVDRGTVQKLIPQLAPLILSGLKRQKDTRGGDERVNHILNKYGDSSALNNIKDLISVKTKATAPDANLGGLLGENGGVQAAQMLAKNMNIDASTIIKMIPALTPVILGALSKKRDTGGAGISGIGALLDADGDGSILDDVAGFILKGGSGQQTKGKGLLGSLLGGMLRPK
jgi:predicted transcriptional regulator